MYSKVIVPLDSSEFSEQALPYAKLIAGHMSAPIELVEAYDILPPAVHDRHTGYIVKLMLTEARSRSEKYLSGIRQRLEETGHPALVTTLRGAPAEAISAQASADANALVLMSTHGRGGIARWALGSVADKVLHTVSNPVLFVRASATAPVPSTVLVERIVAPLDGSARAELSLPHVAGMAAALGAGITLLRVTPTADYYRSHLGGALLQPQVGTRWMSPDDLADADSNQVRAYLSRVKNRLTADRPLEVTIHHQQNENVAQAIIDKASHQPSLVVMSSHGQSGIRRLMLGSIADRVVRHSNGPVLVVR